MINKIKLLFFVLVVPLLFTSCIYIVAEKPYYYSDYEDPETSASYNYYYSYSYSNYPVYALPHKPTPVPTSVEIKQVNINNIIILNVVDNRHIFYRNNKIIAEWYFHPDGRIERKGETINGKVIRYYDNSDIVEWEFEYKNNLRWGQSKRYFNNGKIWEEVYYNNGKRDGLYKMYHPTGKIKKETKYKDGLRNGIYREYQEEGKLIEVGIYKDNKKEIKFRDEKYFKNKRDEIKPIPVQQQKEQATPNVVGDSLMNKGITPGVKNKDKDKEESVETKEIMQEQEIIVEKVEPVQTTVDKQKERRYQKIKKAKPKKQLNKHYKVEEQMQDKSMGYNESSKLDFKEQKTIHNQNIVTEDELKKLKYDKKKKDGIKMKDKHWDNDGQGNTMNGKKEAKKSDESEQ